jgi:hypothetical protein
MATRESRELRKNLLLASALFVLGALYLVYEKYVDPSVQKKQEISGKLLAVDNDAEVEFFEWQRGNAHFKVRCIEACKLGGPLSKFEIVEPIQYRADDSAVTSFITSFVNAKPEHVLAFDGKDEKLDDAKLTEFGLAESVRATNYIRLKTKADEKPHTVFIGNDVPASSNVYAVIEPSRPTKDRPALSQSKNVYLISSALKGQSEKRLTHFRSKRLIDAPPEAIDSIVLKHSGGDYALARDGAQWQMTQSGQVSLADSEAVETFVTGLAFINASDFVSEDYQQKSTQYVLPAKPHYRLEVGYRSAGKKLSITINAFDVLVSIGKGKEPKVYAYIDGQKTLFELDRTHVEKLQKKPTAFRFRNLLTSAERESVQTLRVESEQKSKIVITKKDQVFTLESGSVEKFDNLKAMKFLTNIGLARISNFNATLPAGAALKSKIELLDGNKKLVRSFDVFSDSKNKIYIKTNLKTVYELEGQSGKALVVTAKTFDQSAPEENSAKPTDGMSLPPHDHDHSHDGHSH